MSLPLRPSAGPEKGCQISSVTGPCLDAAMVVCHRYAVVLYLHAAYPAFHSQGIRANTGGKVSENQDNPGRINKTKWFPSVSWPGFMFGSEMCRCLGIQVCINKMGY